MAKSNKKAEENNPIPFVGDQVPTHNKGNFFTQNEEDLINEYQNERIMFSFVLFDRNKEAFNCGGIDASWFISLIDRLKDVSGIEMKTLQTPHHIEKMRIHPHKPEVVEDYFDLGGIWEEQLREGTFYQLNVSQARGRVHGFFIDNTFFVLWLDPHHNLYPSEKHGGYASYPDGVGEYELLEQERDHWRQKCGELEEILESETHPNN
ncbi:hypothetical protein [Salibacterium sp. K-3]